MSANIPQYKLLADHFFEPEVVGKGSIIEFDGIPNNNMEPLNEVAEARLEEWYEERFPLLDDRDGSHKLDHKGEPIYHYPRRQLRPMEQRGVAKMAGIRLLSAPDPQKVAVENTLAGAQNAPAKEWKRPEPDTHTGVKVVKAEPALASNTTKGLL